MTEQFMPSLTEAEIIEQIAKEVYKTRIGKKDDLELAWIIRSPELNQYCFGLAEHILSLKDPEGKPLLLVNDGRYVELDDDQTPPSRHKFYGELYDYYCEKGFEHATIMYREAGFKKVKEDKR